MIGYENIRSIDIKGGPEGFYGANASAGDKLGEKRLIILIVIGGVIIIGGSGCWCISIVIGWWTITAAAAAVGSVIHQAGQLVWRGKAVEFELRLL